MSGTQIAVKHAEASRGKGGKSKKEKARFIGADGLPVGGKKVRKARVPKKQEEVVSESEMVTIPEEAPLPQVAVAVSHEVVEKKEEEKPKVKAKPRAKSKKKAVQADPPPVVEEGPRISLGVLYSLTAPVKTIQRKVEVLTAKPFDERHGRVLWYVGVAHIFIGLCFAAHALSGIYVDGVILSLTEYVPTSLHQRAAVVASRYVGNYTNTYAGGTTPPTTEVQAEAVSTEEKTESVISSTSASATETTEKEEPLVPADTTNIASVSDKVTTGDSAPKEVSTVSGVRSGANATSTADINSDILPAPEKVDVTPAVSMRLDHDGPLAGIVPVEITAPGAKGIELMLRPHGALVMRFVGRVKRLDTGVWKFDWDTTQVPNGEYSLVTSVTNEYGSYEGKDVGVTVRNITPATPGAPVLSFAPQVVSEVETKIATIDAEIRERSSVASTAPDVDESVAEKGDVADKDLSDISISLSPGSDSLTELAPTQAVENRLAEFEAVLNIYLGRLAVALRTGDESSIEYLKSQIESSRLRTITVFGQRKMLSPEELDEFDKKLQAVVKAQTERVELRERIVRERVGETVFTDSDKDGVSDYDETHIYGTDPATPDSDNDGFVDGAEIASGFDPRDDDNEVAMRFEDPHENGPERSDLLSVNSIQTVEGVVVSDSENNTTKNTKVAFAGRGLPNSFVTLYIFSTPVVVTVRTAEDGSWTYAFDKELEDGSHTAYVGMTDNAGRIIAKSAPFTFVKTAEAYTGGKITEPVAAPTYAEPSLVSVNMFLLIVSLLVVLVGLSFVALGAYFARREDTYTPQVVTL